MKITVKRTKSTPPPKTFAIRKSEQAVADRRTALTAILSLKTGQSVLFTGPDVTRERVNNYLASVYTQKPNVKYTTATIEGGLGVWRIS